MHALVLLLLHWSYIYGPTAAIRILSVRAQGLLRKVGRVRGHRQNAERVRVPEATLPALHRNNGRARLDDVELKGVAETEPNTVVDLPTLHISYALGAQYMANAYIRLPLVRLDAAGVGVPEGIASPVEVDLASSLLVAGNCDAKV